MDGIGKGPPTLSTENPNHFHSGHPRHHWSLEIAEFLRLKSRSDPTQVAWIFAITWFSPRKKQHIGKK